MRLKWKLDLVRLEIVLILTQGRCCNTPGICYQLSSGFELKHDKLSNVEGAYFMCLTSISIYIKALEKFHEVGIKSHMEWWVIFLLILTATCIGNKETCLYNPCETSMRTSAYATYKCNMCNTSMKHVKHNGGTLETCTWQQHFETLETRLWNKHCNYSDFYVSMDVRPIFLCNLCMVYMFSLSNTLTTLRTYNGTMFMLIILSNYVSKWWLTK
jgi:hypothetical protein